MVFICSKQGALDYQDSTCQYFLSGFPFAAWVVFWVRTLLLMLQSDFLPPAEIPASEDLFHAETWMLFFLLPDVPKNAGQHPGWSRCKGGPVWSLPYTGARVDLLHQKRSFKDHCWTKLWNPHNLLFSNSPQQRTLKTLSWYNISALSAWGHHETDVPNASRQTSTATRLEPCRGWHPFVALCFPAPAAGWKKASLCRI